MLKKLSCFIAILLSVACMLGGCNLKDEHNLVDFKDTTVTAELGSMIYFGDYIEVLDVDGNTFEAAYEVTTTSGSHVSTIGNTFKVASIEGYKIRLTVGKNSRTLTINVVDTVSPVIRMGEMNVGFGYAGEKYELPQIEYSDLSEIKESSKKVEVYSLEDGEKQFLEIDADNCFMPTKATTYYIVASCEDIYGNASSAQIEFVIRMPAEKNEVEHFRDKISAESFVVGWGGAAVPGGFFVWHEDYEGESGVLEVKFNSAHDTDIGFFYSFIPRLKMEEYSGTKLVVRVFIPADSNVTYLQLGAGQYSSQKWLAKGVWVDCVFDYQVFVKLWTEAEENPSATLDDIQNYFAIFTNKACEGSIYIDKIVVVDDMEENDNGSNDIDFD